MTPQGRVPLQQHLTACLKCTSPWQSNLLFLRKPQLICLPVNLLCAVNGRKSSEGPPAVFCAPLLCTTCCKLPLHGRGTPVVWCFHFIRHSCY